MYRVIRSVLIFSLVAVFVGCEYWNKDMLGYLEYWSETVQMGKVEVSDATIQKNDAGADTIPVAATPTIAAYVINPQSYELLAEIGDSSSADKSVRVSDSAVQSKAQVVAHEPTLLKVQLGPADGSLEHTEFRVDFEAIRKDTMQSSGKVIGVTLRYNTPPVAPTPVVWNYDSSQYEVVKAGEKWEADRDGILYWAYDDSITEETDPNCAKWFSIGGTRHPVAGCKVESNAQVDGLSVFQFNTNYGGTSVAAVDSEGISSPAVASGQVAPLATYVIKYDGNGADGGTAPASQSKTQYMDITLATNSGGLTRIGYRFTGWNTDRNGNGTTYAEGATYSADEGVTLYAKWEPVDAVVLTPESSAVNHGATVTLTPPTRDATICYQIDGADEVEGTPGQMVTVTLYNGNYVPQDATGAYAEIPEGDSVTITAYAKYADDTQSKVTTGDYSLNQYTVSYEGNGNGDVVGNVPDPQTFYSGGSVAIEGGVNRPEMIGYRFTGWNTAPNGNGTPYPAGATYSANEKVTLYAQWEAVETVDFTLGSSAVNHGDPVTLSSKKQGATIYYRIGDAAETTGTLGQPVMVTLYNEKYLPPDATGAYAEIPENGHVTITAYAKYADGTQSKETTGTYTLNQYTVSYEGGGDTSGTVPSEQFYSGGSVAVQSGDSLTKEGYTFKEWLGNDGQFYSQGDVYGEDENLTLTAQWDPNTYTVLFDPNVGSYSAANLPTQKFTYDVEKKLDWNRFTPPTGHEFVGWKGDDDNVYTDEEAVKNLTTEWNGTVTLYAQWGRKLQDSAQVPSGYTSPHAPSTGSSRYVEFGYWPQSVKADGVTVDTKLSKEVGMFTYYLGSDGNWYVKEGDKYYKVEPIVWRVLTESYNSASNVLLLAEKILIGINYWDDDKNNYMESIVRQWLNSNNGTAVQSDYADVDYGFLQTAFTTSAQALIAETDVDNSAASTFGMGESTQDNPYACGNTTDKIFLLSMQEVSNKDYGFAVYGREDSTRIRFPTDYAKATGVNKNSTEVDGGGGWWLRSPFYYSDERFAHTVGEKGRANGSHFVYDYGNDAHTIYRDSNGGIVPALCIPVSKLP